LSQLHEASGTTLHETAFFSYHSRVGWNNFPRFRVVDAESEEMKAAAAVNKVEH